MFNKSTRHKNTFIALFLNENNSATTLNYVLSKFLVAKLQCTNRVKLHLIMLLWRNQLSRSEINLLQDNMKKNVNCKL